MDLLSAAVPGFFATMALERRWLRRRADQRGPTPADYERRDTVASLSMGIGSVLAPVVAERVLAPFVPRAGHRRGHTALVAVAVAAAVTATVADRRRRARTAVGATDDAAAPGPASHRDPADRVARTAAVAAVVAGGAAVTLAWNAATAPDRLWSRRIADLGRGPVALLVAIVGWDAIYYWNHRWMHTSRYMWAYHSVHHSSERYNLSTALRQPVAGAFTAAVPYGLLSWIGVHPDLVEHARAVNLLYQYWIHTDTVRRLGRAERVLNTPSHHRVHHGSNPGYLDRNHGSILITWDRWFETFTEERDDEPVVYGLTKNVDTFAPWRIATHEYSRMLGDVAAADTWSDRLGSVVRGPGWADRRRAVGAGTAAPTTAG